MLRQLVHDHLALTVYRAQLKRTQLDKHTRWLDVAHARLLYDAAQQLRNAIRLTVRHSRLFCRRIHLGQLVFAVAVVARSRRTSQVVVDGVRWRRRLRIVGHGWRCGVVELLLGGVWRRHLRSHLVAVVKYERVLELYWLLLLYIGRIPTVGLVHLKLRQWRLLLLLVYDVEAARRFEHRIDDAAAARICLVVVVEEELMAALTFGQLLLVLWLMLLLRWLRRIYHCGIQLLATAI